MRFLHKILCSLLAIALILNRRVLHTIDIAASACDRKSRSISSIFCIVINGHFVEKNKFSNVSGVI